MLVVHIIMSTSIGGSRHMRCAFLLTSGRKISGGRGGKFGTQNNRYAGNIQMLMTMAHHFWFRRQHSPDLGCTQWSKNPTYVRMMKCTP